MAPLYNFEALGTGAFEFEPVTEFQVMEADAKPNAYKVTASKLKVDVKSDVAKRERPKLVIAGATAYPRVIDFDAFRSIADDIGALLLVDAAHIAGILFFFWFGCS